MKKRWLILMGVLLLSAVPLRSQDGQSKKMIDCSGTISEDGQSFTCDKDHHLWKVANPAVLRDMEGHQARLTYRHTSNADEIFVTSASVIQQQPKIASHNPGDSAFRR